MNNENFKRWFSNSKIVDADGKPLVVYHGTRNPSFTAFKVGSGYTYGDGAYFTPNPERASGYSGLSSRDAEEYGKSEYKQDKYLAGISPGVYPVYLRMENPYYVSSDASIMDIGHNLEKKHPDEYKRIAGDICKEKNYSGIDAVGSAEIGNRWVREAGYDGIIKQWHEGEPLELVVFNANQIKSSVGNDGNYSLSSDDITKEVVEKDYLYYMVKENLAHDKKKCYSWLGPDGKFMPVKYSHGDDAYAIVKDPKDPIMELWKRGYMRITNIGDELMCHNEVKPPNNKQFRELKDLAMEVGMRVVKYEYGDD